MSSSVNKFGSDVRMGARRLAGNNILGSGLDQATNMATGATSTALRFFENEVADITNTKKPAGVSGKPSEKLSAAGRKPSAQTKPPVRVQSKSVWDQFKDTVSDVVEDPVGAVTGAVNTVISGATDIINPLLPNTGKDTTNAVFRDVQEGRIKRSSGAIDSAFEKDPFAYDPQTTLEMQELSDAGKAKEVKSIMEKYELGEGIYGLRRKALDMSKKARGTILTPTFMNNVTGDGGSVIQRG